MICIGAIGAIGVTHLSRCLVVNDLLHTSFRGSIKDCWQGLCCWGRVNDNAICCGITGV